MARLTWHPPLLTWREHDEVALPLAVLLRLLVAGLKRKAAHREGVRKGPEEAGREAGVRWGWAQWLKCRAAHCGGIGRGPELAGRVRSSNAMQRTAFTDRSNLMNCQEAHLQRCSNCW